MGVSYDSTLKSIDIQTEPFEEKSLVSLFHTENKVNKYSIFYFFFF